MDERIFRAPEPEDNDLPDASAAGDLREDGDLPASAYISHAASLFNFSGDPGESEEPPADEPHTRRVNHSGFTREDPDGAVGRDAAPGGEDGPVPPFLQTDGPVPSFIPEEKPAPESGRAPVVPDPALMPEEAGKNQRGGKPKRFYVLLAVGLSVAVLAGAAVLFFLLHGNPFKTETGRINVPSSMPETTEEIVGFYRIAADAVARDGLAGFRRKQWQTISDVNLTGIGLVDDIVNGALRQYVTPEGRAKSESFPKETQEAKEAFPAFALKDLSYVKSASCVRVGDHYQITIVFHHEDTPNEKDSFLGQVTDAVIFWDAQIEPILEDISQLRAYEDVHVDFTDMTIEAEIRTDGRFVSVRHNAPATMTIGSARIGIFTFTDKSLRLESTVSYTDFRY
jgi:hypothetical protein